MMMHTRPAPQPFESIFRPRRQTAGYGGGNAGVETKPAAGGGSAAGGQCNCGKQPNTCPPGPAGPPGAPGAPGEDGTPGQPGQAGGAGVSAESNTPKACIPVMV
jgi:hypothetical protein